MKEIEPKIPYTATDDDRKFNDEIAASLESGDIPKGQYAQPRINAPTVTDILEFTGVEMPRDGINVHPTTSIVRSEQHAGSTKRIPRGQKHVISSQGSTSPYTYTDIGSEMQVDFTQAQGPRVESEAQK